MSTKSKFKYIIATFTLFLFLSNVYTNAITVKTVNIVFVGDQKSGKTSLRNALIQKPFLESYKSTNTSDMVTNFIPYDESTLLACELWDTSGRDDLKTLILDYRARQSDFIVITVDISKYLSPSGYTLIDNFNSWVCPILERSKNSHLLLVGTKVDNVRNIEQYNEIAKKFVNYSQCYNNRITPLLVSSKNKTNIGNFFEIIKSVINSKNKLEFLPVNDYRKTGKNEPDDGGCIIL